MGRKREPPPDDLQVVRLNGIEYFVNWDQLTVGASFFLPTVSTPAQVKAALRDAERYLRIKLAVRARVEYERYGARVWRIY